MLRKIATMVGYSRAPKATFIMRHPVKGTKALWAAKGTKAVAKSRVGAALGLAVLVPVGMLAFRARARAR